MLENVVVYGFGLYAIIALIGMDFFEDERFRTFIYGGGYLLFTGMVLAYHKLFM